MSNVFSAVLTIGRVVSCDKSRVINLPDNTREIGFERLKDGYIEVKTDLGFRRKHMFVMEQHIGRKLSKDEVVHHIDEDKMNNDISNLKLMSFGEHTKLHHTGSKRSAETKNKISLARRKFTKEQAQIVRAIVNEGTTQKRAAEITGISEMVISRMVRNLIYKEQ